MILIAVLAAGARDLGLYQLPEDSRTTIDEQSESLSALRAVGESIFDSAETAVTIALNLVGIMAFFLGLMRIVEKAGAINGLTRLLAPLLTYLFPGVPRDHPAFAAIVMNIAANMLGLGNAATPFGIKAMEELQKLNPEPDSATPAMVTFLVINTSAITLVPATVLGIRAALNSTDVAAFVLPAIFAAACATLAGLLVVKSWSIWRRPNA
jgi:spore maturation protein A